MSFIDLPLISNESSTDASLFDRRLFWLSALRDRPARPSRCRSVTPHRY
jgi:hypothetical protein